MVKCGSIPNRAVGFQKSIAMITNVGRVSVTFLLSPTSIHCMYSLQLGCTGTVSMIVVQVMTRLNG